MNMSFYKWLRYNALPCLFQLTFVCSFKLVCSIPTCMSLRHLCNFFNSQRTRYFFLFDHLTICVTSSKPLNFTSLICIMVIKKGFCGLNQDYVTHSKHSVNFSFLSFPHPLSPTPALISRHSIKAHQ